MAEIPTAVVQPPRYEEGTKARGPNGELAVFTNGQWEVKNATAEDIKNIAVPSLVRGTAGLASTPRGLYDTATSGIDWLLDKTLGKVLPESVVNRAKEARDNPDPAQQPRGQIKNPLELWPSHEDIMGKVKDVTGRAFDEQAETPIGSLVQTGLELAPSVAAGPGSLIRKGGSLVGASLGSEGGGWLGHQFDAEDGSTNYEGLGRVIGAAGGQYAPAVARRALTPKPVSAQRAADNKLLEDSGIQLRSGQAAGPGFLDTLERDNVKWGNPIYSPKGQREQFGQFAHKEANVTGPQAKAGLTEVSEINPSMRSTGKEIEKAYQAARPKTDPKLTTDMHSVWANATPATKKILEPHFDQIMYRPSRAGATSVHVPGKGYLVGPNSTLKGDELRQQMNSLTQQANKLAKKGDVQSAGSLRELGATLRGAVDRSLVGTPHENLPQLRTQYTNQRALKDLKVKQGGTPDADLSPMPKDVYQALGGTRNPNAQTNKLGQISDIAGRRGVGSTVPWDMSSYSHHPWWTIAGATAGGLGSAYAPSGVDSPILGTLLGGAGAAALRSNPVMAKLLLNRGTQSWLKNQRFLPGKHTAPDHAAALRILGGMPPRPEEGQ